MGRILAIAALLWTIPAAAAGSWQQPAVTRTERLAELTRRLSEDCEAGRFAGVVKAAEDGQLVLEHVCGLADIPGARPMSHDTVFKAFSVSKGLTGLVIMQLAERGVVQLDAPIRTYVPEAPASWASVTLRRLLHHTSGAPDLTDQLLAAYTGDGARDHASAMAMVLKASGPTALSGEGVWRYNNFGYELLALAAARASGCAFEDLVRDRLFRPAGMGDAAWELPPPWRPSPHLAQGYNGAPERLEPATSLVYVQQGAGALHASADDLLALDRAWREGRLIGEEMSRENIRAAVPASETVKYGYGWMVRETHGRIYLQHSGGDNGFAVEFARAVDKPVAVVVMSNRGFADVSGLRRDLMAALLAP